MNQTEKRRKKLLEQTRNLYRDQSITPAVHPRYQAAYSRLYPDEESVIKSTFGIRIIICVVIFAFFVLNEQNGFGLYEIDNLQVLNYIMQNNELKLF